MGLNALLDRTSWSLKTLSALTMAIAVELTVASLILATVLSALCSLDLNMKRQVRRDLDRIDIMQISVDKACGHCF